MSHCKKFAPNIFYKSKCSNCFRQKDEHSSEALECNRATRSVARNGYLFVAPDWDFSVPLNRTKRWQRRWFVLYDDGELNYSVDEHPETVPQGSVDMCQILEVTGAEEITGHQHSLALTGPDRVTFIKAASREDAKCWAELLAVFPRRHKRNATFPGGRASPSLHQLGRSSSPQPARPRHLSCLRSSTKANYFKMQNREEKPSIEIKSEPTSLPDSLSVEIEVESPQSVDCIDSSSTVEVENNIVFESKISDSFKLETQPDISTTPNDIDSNLVLQSENSTCLKKGWLWLQTSEEWKRQWVVLYSQLLYVFQDQDEDSAPNIVVEMCNINECTEVCGRRKYCFQILSTNTTLTLSAVTTGTRSSWIAAIKKAVSNKNTSSLPLTLSRSILLSSDEEYRTASEGGRRGSEDWNESPSSPHLNHVTLNKLKERVRNRVRLPKCSSRQSTLDSTSTEEFESSLMEQEKIELQNVINKQNIEIDNLQKQLKNALDKVDRLENELERVKNESLLQDEKIQSRLNEIKDVEINLSRSNLQDKILSVQEQLLEAQEHMKKSEERCDILTKDLQSKLAVIVVLQEELKSVNEKLSNSQPKYDCVCKNFDSSNNSNRTVLVNSLADLTNINLDVDFDVLNQNELIEYCLDIKSRFEKAVTEIRAVKKELRESDAKYDHLELKNFCLKRDLEVAKEEAQAEVALMAIRLDHLTTKLASAEKQLRIKSKQDFKERRSLSLKGGETTFNKEIEDKIVELETKILVLEKNNLKRKYKRDRSNERNSPIDDKSLRRLRRRSLEDSSAVDPIKVLIRLDSLENKVTGINDPNETHLSNTSLNISSKGCICRFSDENSNLKTWIKAGEKIKLCLNQVNLIKSFSKTKTYKDKIALLESGLLEVESILFCQNCNTQLDELNNSANNVVKQLQSLLLQKLISIAEKKKLLRESNKLDTITHLELLAEKIAYENILIGRIHEALDSTVNEETFRDSLLNKEIKETEFLVLSLQNKLNGIAEKNLPTCKTSAEYLTKVLAQFLTLSVQRCNKATNNNKFVQKNKTSLFYLLEEQNRVNAAYKMYKTNKLPVLAEALAVQAICLASDKSCVLHTLNQELIKDFNTVAHDTINAELILSEINHVLLRAAQIYEANMKSDYTFCFSFFAYERAILELWVESVENNLYVEINNSITELTEYYQNFLNKLKLQNWRNSVKLENTNITSLLNEFADVVAHKALIDARINVLIGQYNLKNFNDIESEHVDLNKRIKYDRLWMDLEDHSLVQINQSLEAEFKCMLEKYANKCLLTLDKTVFKEVIKNLHNLSNEIHKLQKVLKIEVSDNDVTIENWCDVCQKCQHLCDQVKYICDLLNSKFHTVPNYNYKLEDGRLYPLNYLNQVNNLRMVYKNIVKTCEKEHLLKVEHLQNLWEQVLFAVEHWFYCTIQNMKDAHSSELQALQQDKERALAEETQATLAALDAMQKAHEAEVQKEISRFKENFVFQQKNEILNLSEKLAIKSLEASALEEQLRNITKQLVQAHQHILQLKENPQESSVQN